MGNDRIAKRVHEKCMGSRLVGQALKKCVDSVNDYLKKEVWMLDKSGE